MWLWLRVIRPTSSVTVMETWWWSEDRNTAHKRRASKNSRNTTCKRGLNNNSRSRAFFFLTFVWISQSQDFYYIAYYTKVTHCTCVHQWPYLELCVIAALIVGKRVVTDQERGHLCCCEDTSYLATVTVYHATVLWMKKSIAVSMHWVMWHKHTWSRKRMSLIVTTFSVLCKTRQS